MQTNFLGEIMKLLLLGTLLLSFFAFTSCSSMSHQDHNCCKKHSEECKNGCKKDKSCCDDKCKECDGKDSCANGNCAHSHTA